MVWYYTYTFLCATLFILTSANAKNLKQFQGFKKSCLDTSPECLKQSLQAFLPQFVQGFPELGIASLDPFEVDRLVFILRGDIKIEFKDTLTKGLRKCNVDFLRHIEEDKFDIQFGCNLINKGKYRSTGHLLMFPIDGEGHATIITKNLKIRCAFKLSHTIKEDGLKYIEMNDIKTSHSFEGRVIFNMTNLFKENSDLSAIVLDFMNQNWYMIADEFGSPIIEYWINSILNNLKRLFKAVPINNLLIT